jgi:hypothetical protein
MPNIPRDIIRRIQTIGPMIPVFNRQSRLTHKSRYLSYNELSENEKKKYASLGNFINLRNSNNYIKRNAAIALQTAHGKVPNFLVRHLPKPQTVGVKRKWGKMRVPSSHR